MPSAVILSVHSYPALRLAPQQVHQWNVHPGPLVLGATLLKSPTPTADRDRTVSRRSKPSSRTSLKRRTAVPLGPAPAHEMSRHRGAKRCRRYGLLGTISLLSPAYLLSVERWPPTWDHRITMDFRLCSTCQSCSQAGFCHCTQRAISDALSQPSRASLLFRRRPPQSNTRHTGPGPDNGPRLDIKQARVYLKGGSMGTSVPLQSLPLSCTCLA